MTRYNFTNLTDTVNLYDIILVVNNQFARGFLGWAWIIIIFSVLYAITAYTKPVNRFSYACFGASTVGIFLVAIEIIPPYSLILFIFGLGMAFWALFFEK